MLWRSVAISCWRVFAHRQARCRSFCSCDVEAGGASLQLLGSRGFLDGTEDNQMDVKCILLHQSHHSAMALGDLADGAGVCERCALRFEDVGTHRQPLWIWRARPAVAARMASHGPVGKTYSFSDRHFAIWPKLGASGSFRKFGVAGNFSGCTKRI